MSKNNKLSPLGPFGGFVTKCAVGTSADQPKWMLILPAGEFSARDGRGPWTTGDAAGMQVIIDRTFKFYGETELMVDYDHQMAAEEPIQVKAAGWIKKLEVRADGIWAFIKWTKAAHKMIEDEEYKYLSPFFAESKKARVLLIMNVALVNTPALDLPAIAARVELKTKGKSMEQLLKLLGLKKGASEKDIQTALSALTDFRSGVMTALGVEDDVSNDDVTTALTALTGARATVAKAIGLKDDATGDEIVAAATTLKSTKAGDPDPAKFVPIEVVAALQADMKEFREERAGESAEALVAAAIEDGKLAPILKVTALALAKSDMTLFNEFIDGSPVLTNQQLGDGKTNKAKDSITALSADQAAIATQLGIPAKEYLATLNDEQEQEYAN